MKRALVTGGDGFVGQHLLPALLGRGYEVTGSVLALPPGRVTITPEQTEAVDWKIADVTDPAALYRLVAAAQPDVVFHLAGFSSAEESLRDPAEALRVNAGGTVNLLEALLSVREDFPDLDPCIVVMSSGATYGAAAITDLGFEEETALQPTSPYSVSKACQELVADSYRRSRGLRIVVARVFNLVGSGQREDFAVPSFCRQVADIQAGRSKPPLRVGNVNVERDFLDVRDGVVALAELAELSSPKTVYNVGSGKATRVSSLLDWILQEAGAQIELLTDPERVREGEEAKLLANIDRIVADTGWRPARRLEETIRETYR